MNTSGMNTNDYKLGLLPNMILTQRSSLTSKDGNSFWNFSHSSIIFQFYIYFDKTSTFGDGFENVLGSGIPELKNRVEKPSYQLWRDKTELSQIVTP